MPIHPVKLLKQRERTKALHDARKQLLSVMAQERLNRAARDRVTGAADSNFKIGDTVLVYRSKYGKWVGPCRVIDYDYKNFQIEYNGPIVISSHRSTQEVSC